MNINILYYIRDWSVSPDSLSHEVRCGQDVIEIRISRYLCTMTQELNIRQIKVIIRRLYMLKIKMNI